MAFILSILIFYLSVQPCADGQADEVRDQTEQVVDSPNHKQDYGQSTEDECTPLCSCHCCHIHLLAKDEAKAVALPNVTVHSQLYLENPSQEVTRSILQPPRV